MTGRSLLWPPVVLFYVVALLGAGLLGAVQPWTGLDPQILSLTQFGPSIGVAVVLVAFPPVRAVVAATFGGRPGLLIRQLSLLSATAVLIFAVCLGVYAALGKDPAVLPAAALVAPLWLIVPAQWVGSCGEELGWRCLLQPLVRGRLAPAGASASVGLLWGVWHVQVFAAGVGFASAFLVSAVALSVIMGLAIHRAGGHNLALAATFHLLVNLGLLLLLDEEDGDTTAMWVFALTSVLLAAAWALADRRPVPARPRPEWQAG